MKRIYHYICLLILSVILLPACSDDNKEFEGKDNYITSFSLRLENETELNGLIEGNKITINASSSQSLERAKATVKLSENAKIFPNPEEITNWEEDIVFAVTSYNGTRSQYKYTVNRTEQEQAGTIILATQADVDAFGQKGITSIAGNLILGQISGKDSIKSLSPLAGLTQIGYSLIVYPTVDMTNFEGLENLTKVGDLIQIESSPRVQSVLFPALEMAGGVALKNDSLITISFPKLKNVSKSFVINSGMGQVILPSLERVGETFRLTNTFSNVKALMPSVILPYLKEVGSIELSRLENVKKVDFSELKTIADLNLYPLEKLIYINAPKLQIITGKLTTSATSKLSEFSLPELEEVNDMIVEGKQITTVNLPKLKRVKGKLSLNYAKINGLAKGFESLETVEGELYMLDLAMKDLIFPSSIKKINRLSIYNYLSAPLTKINIKGMNIKELAVMASAVDGVEIIGDDVFNGTLSILPDNAKSYTLKFPKLQGFSEVDSLSLGSYISNIDVLNIKGIKKIKKGLTIPNNNLQDFSISDLEEVGGNFTINHLNNIVDPSVIQINISDLKNVGGNFNVTIDSRSVRTLNVPKLESVGRDFTIGTGYMSTSSWSPSCHLRYLLFPKLTSIEGKMSLVPYKDDASKVNEELTDLNGFSALKKVSGIEIKAQAALVSYAGLKNALSALTAGQWIVERNGYNPTYDQLKSGAWTKP